MLYVQIAIGQNLNSFQGGGRVEGGNEVTGKPQRKYRERDDVTRGLGGKRGRNRGCVPERCGRVVFDQLVSGSEADALLKIAQQGLALGGSEGGASILDLHSGALSQGKNFVNIYKLDQAKGIFRKSDFIIYKVVKTKIQHAVAHHFGVRADALHLTHPTFFSRLTSAPAKTVHDEYWHPHVDKETYESFHYTSLLYLTDYGHDFQGGRFVFVDKDNSNKTVEPRKEKVSSGTRYAITVSFTCDEKYAIDDPAIPMDAK
uniref:Prolyl 4-hydroxylase alpha subunit domain-containing protein n=1 Tax=Timema genevievae TaxID=629358 RepID=A0A7R9PKY7_TIMGE|nr:unnamed protein product [Timema genevievae]